MTYDELKKEEAAGSAKYWKWRAEREELYKNEYLTDLLANNTTTTYGWGWSEWVSAFFIVAQLVWVACAAYTAWNYFL